MERPLDEQGSDVKCPNCGLVIKVMAASFKFCPVCGAPLPEMSPSQKIASKSIPKMISLEQALSKSAKSMDSWSLKEILNLFVLTTIITLMAKYIFLSFWLQGNQSGEITFDPLLIIVTYLTETLAGIIPILYVLYYKLSFRKIGWNKLDHAQWGRGIVLGVLCGMALFLFDMITTVFNAAIYQATGWSLFSQNDQFQIDFNAFMESNFPWNKLLIILFLGVQLVISEILFRGTILKGALQNRQKHHGLDRATIARLQALAISISLNTLFGFILSFDVTTIVFNVLANFVLGLLFMYSKNVQSCMIAQIVYVILVLIF